MKNIGGQAVIEGVMMKSPKAWTVAVRGPNKEIFFQKNSLTELPKLLKKPILRGFVALVQALVIGIKALAFSAEKAMPAEEEKPSSFSMGITVFISFVIGLIIFLLLPLVRLMTAPGLYLQRLTAREPSRDQIDVAVEALREVLKMESVIM